MFFSPTTNTFVWRPKPFQAIPGVSNYFSDTSEKKKKKKEISESYNCLQKEVFLSYEESRKLETHFFIFANNYVCKQSGQCSWCAFIDQCSWIVKSLSVPRFATPWTVAHQAPLSMEFSTHEYQSGLLFPSPGYLPDPGIKPRFPHCMQMLYCLSHQGSPL